MWTSQKFLRIEFETSSVTFPKFYVIIRERNKKFIVAAEGISAVDGAVVIESRL